MSYSLLAAQTCLNVGRWVKWNSPTVLISMLQLQKIHRLIHVLQLAYMDGRNISPIQWQKNFAWKEIWVCWEATTQTRVGCFTFLCDGLYCHLSYCRLCKLIGTWLLAATGASYSSLGVNCTVAYMINCSSSKFSINPRLYAPACPCSCTKYERINKYSFQTAADLPARMRRTVALFFPNCFTSHITAK